MKGWKKLFHVNGNKKKMRRAKFISHKIDFKADIVMRDKEGNFRQRNQFIKGYNNYKYTCP